MFKHQDATTAWVTLEMADSIERVLVVETNLRLSPISPEYDAARAEALMDAVRAYRAQHKNYFDKIRLVSTKEK